ncbi:probable pectinesterase/pectinesterase inhibitor 51 [Phoenix dactylifera]|uniref:Pectinesterase n=1 Tax=Phoenix dactylifera TaxID=42345 RepID=A0A8B7BW12_PHODC|nr:probable pectinesterase/pectinesterase inhibitor 51 [Phoenix dactylifera]
MKKHPTFRCPRVLLLLSMATLLSLLFLLVLLPPSPSAAAGASLSQPPSQVRQACRATRFPSSCESTLTKSRDLTPLGLTLASLSVSSAALPTASSLVQSILAASSSNLNRSNAARNCLEHLSLSDRRLAAASAALPRGRAADARAWTSAALLYQYDCNNSLSYVSGTRLVADAMAFLSSLYDLTSNALSLIAARQRFGDDLSLWSPPQTERDGYWGDPAAAVGRRSASRIAGLLSDLQTDATVCRIGDCNYRTVQDAVAAAPDFGAGRFVIRIKTGIYKETVRIPFEKTNVVLIGDGIGATVITGALNVQMPGVWTYNTATVGVLGDGFMARDLTIENTAGAGAHQAVALRLDSDHSVLDTVELRGHQDTLYARSLRQLYRRCRISGTVDFVFGNAAAVFDECLLEVVTRAEGPGKSGSDAVTAQGRTDPAQATGFVFRRCAVNGSEEFLTAFRRKPKANRVFLGRPWKEYARVVFIETYLGEVVSPEGWLRWRGEFALDTLFYGEYGSYGPGANNTSRVKWSSQIPAIHLVVYSVENFIQGNEWIPSDQ